MGAQRVRSKVSFATDSVLRERFVPLTVLKRGRLTNVYLVRDRATPGKLVLKVPQEGSGQDAQVSLRNEAGALGLLRGEPAVRLIEHGTTEEGTLYVLATYERGEPLTQVLERTRLPPVAWCVSLLESLLSALSQVHQSGVVHGDVSPGNCLIVASPLSEPQVRLLDFGAARFAGSERNTATFGTAAYASPECVLGEEVSPSSDVYSAGVLAYELLCGHPPFRAGTTSELIWQHLYEDPEPFPTYGRGQVVPRQLVDAIFRALLKDPEKRLGSAQEFASMLREAQQSMRQELSKKTRSPSTVPGCRATHLRALVLERLRVHWLQGVLGEATSGLILVRQRVIEDQTSEQRSVCDAQAVDSLERGNHLLLLTGEAGYGKTINLLRIARVFADRAESRTDRRLPIVLGLGSWRSDFQSLEDWLARELQTHYLVSPKVTREWVSAERLVLLLDGLDELEDRDRQTCVDAIHRFRVEQADVSIALTSRPDAVALLERRPEASTTLRLLPLLDEDIRRQLPRGRDAEFCRAIETDPVLADAIRTPVLLHVARLGFKQEIVALSDARSVRFRLFEGFLSEIAKREFSQPGAMEFGLFLGALRRIATTMCEQRTGTFVYESLQPKWLPSLGWQLLYLFLTRMLAASVYAAGIILAVGLTPLDNRGFETSLGFGLELAIVGGLILGIATFADSAVEIFSRTARSKTLIGVLLRTAQIGLFAGVLTVVCTSTQHPGARTMALQTGLLGALVLVLSRRGRSVLEFDIGQREQLSWSHKSIAPLKWVPLLIVSSLMFALALQFETAVAATYLALSIFGAGIAVAGLDAHPAARKMAPNIGTWMTLKNATVVGSLTFLVTTLLVSLHYGFIVGASLGLNLGSILFLWAGGIDAFNHLILRTLLLASGVLPARSLQVLALAGRLGLVRRTGNGFLFMHAMLQEHLSSGFSQRARPASMPLPRLSEDHG